MTNRPSETDVRVAIEAIRGRPVLGDVERLARALEVFVTHAGVLMEPLGERHDYTAADVDRSVVESATVALDKAARALTPGADDSIEASLLTLVRQWKHHWMMHEGEEYRHRAHDIDSNMVHDLVRRLLTGRTQ